MLYLIYFKKDRNKKKSSLSSHRADTFTYYTSVSDAIKMVSTHSVTVAHQKPMGDVTFIISMFYAVFGVHQG